MAEMGNGYGSECHLLRFMGRHRKQFDQAVLRAIGRGTGIDWEDFGFDPKNGWLDEEHKGLGFLGHRPQVLDAWSRWWPQGGGIMNWDCIGWLVGAEPKDLLLVEAKAHVGELISSTGAKGGLEQIKKAMSEVKTALGAKAEASWTEGYYQYANRLAVLHFLTKQDVLARLVCVYFVGDRSGNGRQCPESLDVWKDAIERQRVHLGLPEMHGLSDRIHKVFLHVQGACS